MTRNGIFLVCDSTNTNYNINLPMTTGTVVRKIVLDVDVFVSGWDPNKTNGWHNIFWLHKGIQPNSWSWSGGVVGYLNLRGPGGTGNRLILEISANADIQNTTSYSAALGEWYHLTYTYEPAALSASYVWSKGGVVERNRQVALASSDFVVQNKGFFIQFGTQVAPEGPEANTYGWKFSNMKIDFFQ